MMTEAVERELRKELKEMTSLTVQIEVQMYESLERFELKADRLTDNRPNHA